MPSQPNRPLRVMLVDDSVVARKLILDALADQPEIGAVVTAPSGRIALQKSLADTPDVAIIDLEMPEMDGIELIGALRRAHPEMRLLLHTANDAAARHRAVQALTEGASDVLIKPRLPMAPYPEQVAAVRALLLPKLTQFGARVPARVASPPAIAAWADTPRPWALAIGVSTGGPEALHQVLPALPAHFPLPILIVQHVPPGFTAPLAARLDRASAITVVEAEEGLPVLPGRAYLAPGGFHMEVDGEPTAARLRLTLEPPENFCRPAVDVLFRSAARVYGGRLVVAVMTGMGADGLEGARLCRERGARVLAQDEATSVVWGMPGAVTTAGLADAVLPLDRFGPVLTAIASGRRPEWA